MSRICKTSEKPMPKSFTPLIVCLANNPQSSLGFLQLSNRLLALGHPYSSKSTCRMFSFFNRSFSIWPPLKATTFSSVVHSAQLRLNNQEVIDRLTQLLNSPHLEQQLNQVRTTIRTVVARRGKGKTKIFFSFFSVSCQCVHRDYRHFVLHLMAVLEDEHAVPFFRVDDEGPPIH